MCGQFSSSTVYIDMVFLRADYAMSPTLSLLSGVFSCAISSSSIHTFVISSASSSSLCVVSNPDVVGHIFPPPLVSRTFYDRHLTNIHDLVETSREV